MHQLFQASHVYWLSLPPLITCRQLIAGVLHSHHAAKALSFRSQEARLNRSQSGSPGNRNYISDIKQHFLFPFLLSTCFRCSSLLRALSDSVAIDSTSLVETLNELVAKQVGSLPLILGEVPHMSCNGLCFSCFSLLRYPNRTEGKDFVRGWAF